MTLIYYFSRAFLGRFLAILFSLAAILQLLDLLDNADEVLAGGHGALDMLIYISLRLPMLITQLVPLAVLVGLLATFFGLARHNEIVALRFAGVTPWFFMKLLAPSIALVTVAHILLLGQVVPVAEVTLRTWWAKNIEPPKPTPDNKILWLRAGNDIISLQQVENSGHRLDGVTIYGRDDKGRITHRIVAAHAQWQDGHWTLDDVDTITLNKGQSTTIHTAHKPWPQGPSPKNVAFVADPPQFLSPQRSLSILRGTWAGTQPPAYYETQFQNIFAVPLSSFIMLLLAQPSLRDGRRGQRFAVGAGSGLILGLLYLLVQGLTTALAEADTLPPTLAVWSPLVLFACIGGTIVLHMEE